MKRLHGEATAIVAATAAECASVLADVDGYVRWYPEVVRAAKVVATGRDGSPTRAEVTLHVSRGPLERVFELEMQVDTAQANRVLLSRIPRDSSDEEEFAVAWEIADGGERRTIRLGVDASLAVPRFMPLGNIGDDLAAGFLTAAARVLNRS